MFKKNVSKRNQRGVVVLLILLLCITVAPRVYKWLFPRPSIQLNVVELDYGVQEIKQNESRASKERYQKYQKKERYKAPPKKFDPNTYTATDWMKLGLSEKQANTVLKFSIRGLYSNEQLKKIFVIDEQLYDLIKDSTFYPERKYVAREATTKEDFHTPKLQTDINSATHEELLKLPGIGEFYAKKIIEYREKLGGFVNEKQLLELYNFNDEKLDKLSGKIIVDKAHLQTININTVSVEQLAKHPYFPWNIANSVIKMRAKYTRYTSLEQLLESALITKEKFEKMKPYLVL